VVGSCSLYSLCCFPAVRVAVRVVIVFLRVCVCFSIFSPLYSCVGQVLFGRIKIVSVTTFFFLMKNVLRHDREKKSKHTYPWIDQKIESLTNNIICGKLSSLFRTEEHGEKERKNWILKNMVKKKGCIPFICTSCFAFRNTTGAIFASLRASCMT